MRGNTPQPGEAGPVRSGRRSHWPASRWLGAAIPLLLILLLFLSRAVDTGFVYYPPLLFSALNISFAVVISLVVAYMAARSYLATGQPQLAWLGGGMLVFGLGNLLSALAQTQLNVSVTMHNTSALLAAVFNIIGAALMFRGHFLRQKESSQYPVLFGIYSVGTLLILLVYVLSLRGMTPVFFIPGVGATLARQVVILAATALFGTSAILLLFHYSRRPERVGYWYSLGLILIALGLLTVSFVKTPGDIFAWVGRSAQYFGGIYLVVAVLIAIREARARQVPVAEIMAKFTEQANVNYELLVNSASDAIIAVDGAGRILLWNPAAERMFGYSRNEAIGLVFFDLIVDPEQVESYQKTSETFRPESVGPGTPVMMELRARRKNGEEFPVSLTLASRELVARWRPTATTLVMRDITERKQAEEAIHYQASILNLTAIAILATDANFKIMIWNHAAEELFGYMKEEMIGKRLSEVVKVDLPVLEVQREFLEKGFWQGDMTATRKDGRSVVVSATGKVIKDKVGNVIGSIGTYADITERKKAEETIRYQADLLGIISDAIISTDRRFAVQSWNKAAEELYGWKSAEVIGKRTAEFLPAEYATASGREEAGNRFLKDGHWDGEVTYTRKDGGKVTVWARAIASRDEQGNITGAASVHRDITERKRAEELIRFQSLLVDSTHDAVISSTLTPGGEFVTRTWNKGAEALYGWRSEEVIGKPTISFLQPEFPPPGTLQEYIRQFLEQGRWDGEVITKRKDGSKVVALTSQTVLRDAGGTIIGAVGVHHDITELKKADEALRKAHSELAANDERLKRSQEIAHLGSWELALASNRLTWSDEVYRIFGLKPQEFGATYGAFLDAIHPDDRMAVDKAYSGSVSEGRDSYEIEHRIVRKSSGEIRYVHERCQHVRDESGKIVRSIGMVQDITERKNVEHALLESEERFFKAFHSSPIPMTIARLPEGRWVDVNDSFLSMLEYTRDEVIDHTSTELNIFPRPDERHQVLKVFLNKGRVQDRELTVRTKTGKLLTVLSSNEKVSLSGQEHAVSIIVDITERKKTEDELEKHRAHLEEMVRERTAELEKTMKALAEQVERSRRAEQEMRSLSERVVTIQEEERRAVARELHDEVGQYLTFIRMTLERAMTSPHEGITPVLSEATEQVADLLKRVRNLSLELRPSMLDDLGLLPALLWLFDQYHDQSGLQVDFAHDHTEDVPLKLNTAAFRIIQSSLTNVVRHSGTKEASVRVWVDDGALYVTVEDRGHGFDMAAQAVGASTGISAMRERARLMGGKLTVDSAPGAGTRILAELPLLQVPNPDGDGKLNQP